jgi:hypothetical protein
MEMSKNLWDKERNSVFKELTKEYLDEGYSLKDAKKFARKETAEVMADKLDFAEDIFIKSFADW